MIRIISHAVRRSLFRRFYLLILIPCLGYGCAGTPFPDDFEAITHANLPIPDMTITVPGFSHCTDARDVDLKLNSNEPVTIIVHGCYSSAANYRALAEVFAFHGQQTICFNYDYRESMMNCASQLIGAVKELATHMQNRKITIVAHSQGGLIARKAFTREKGNTLEEKIEDLQLNLVTISSPFAGIKAAAHCGPRLYFFLTLGLQVPICKLLAGNKWNEIPAASEYIQEPGHLISEVQWFYQVVTDERDACRRWGKNGRCVEDDYVFSLGEQYFHKIAAAPGVTYIQVKSGHTEIVGNETRSPTKLIGIFQDIGVLAQTPPKRLAGFQKLLEALY